MKQFFKKHQNRIMQVTYIVLVVYVLGWLSWNIVQYIQTLP